MRNILQRMAPYLLSIIAGFLLWAAFPKLSYSYLVWIALVPLFFALEKKDLVQSFLLGFLAGLTFVVWKFLDYATIHPILPYVTSFNLAFYFGLFAVIYRFICDRFHFSPLVIIPTTWVAVEFSRIFGPFAFPIGFIAYSQHNYLPVIQIVDFGGIYLLSFLIVLFNAALFSLLKNILSHRHVIGSLFIVFSIMAFILGYGFLRINQFSQPHEKNFRVAIIQPNINYYSNDYDPLKSLDTVDELTMQASRANPDLIIWPESVIKGQSLSDPRALKKLLSIAKKYGHYLVYGVPRTVKFGNQDEVLISAILNSPAGKEIGIYSKHKLLPFAENFTEFLSNLGLSKYVYSYCPGNEFTLFKIPKARFGVTICFDAYFPRHVSKFARMGAQFLVNIADDSFANSITMHYQTYSMGVFRAVENRTYYIRSANSGISMVIDPKGQKIAVLPAFKRGIIVADIGTQKYRTYYDRYGDFVAHASAFIVGFLVLLSLLSNLLHFFGRKKRT